MRLHLLIEPPLVSRVLGAGCWVLLQVDFHSSSGVPGTGLSYTKSGAALADSDLHAGRAQRRHSELP